MEMQDLCGDFKTHLIEKGNVTSFKLKFEICRIKLNKLGIFFVIPPRVCYLQIKRGGYVT